MLFPLLFFIGVLLETISAALDDFRDFSAKLSFNFAQPRFAPIDIL